MTLAISDGVDIWAFRYSSEGKSRTLFFTSAPAALRALYPDNPLFDVTDETRVIVSEPLGGLPGVWNEVPESCWGVVQPGDDRIERFTPRGRDMIPG